MTDKDLDEIILEHAREVLRVENDPFGKNVDWVKAGNKAKQAIYDSIMEIIGRNKVEESDDTTPGHYKVNKYLVAENRLRTELRQAIKQWAGKD